MRPRYGRLTRALAAILFACRPKRHWRCICDGYSAGAAGLYVTGAVRRFARSSNFTISIPISSTAATRVVTTQSISVSATVWKATCRNGTSVHPHVGAQRQQHRQKQPFVVEEAAERAAPARAAAVDVEQLEHHQRGERHGAGVGFVRRIRCRTLGEQHKHPAPG